MKKYPISMNITVSHLYEFFNVSNGYAIAKDPEGSSWYIAAINDENCILVPAEYGLEELCGRAN
jgi:hypothetical protein